MTGGDNTDDLWLDPEAGAAWGGFLRTHAALLRAMDADLQANHQMALSTYEVLLILARAPERRAAMSTLAEAAFLSASGLTRLVERSERLGWIVREPSEHDRRSFYARLTDRGWERWMNAHRAHQAAIKRLFLDRFSPEEVALLAAFWRRFPTAGDADGFLAPAETPPAGS